MRTSAIIIDLKLGQPDIIHRPLAAQSVKQRECGAAAPLTVNATLANPINQSAGASYIWRITQDGTGGRTLAYGSAFKWPGGTAPVLSTAAGATDLISGISDGAALYGVMTQAFA